jgi:hypothetical protein
LAALFAGCGDADEPSTPERPSGDVSYLSPLEHLARASMALRGMRPAVQELEAVAADPSALDTLEDARAWADRIWVRAADHNATMPPVGGPEADERSALGEWLACGAPSFADPQ